MKWSTKTRRTFVAFTVTILLVTFNFISLAQAAPQRTTYQAKIIKPDGNPLEASSVNFRFTVMDPAGTCILYVEDFTALNMSNSGGLIALPLGSGTKSYPTSGTTTFSEFFDNSSGPRTCQVGATPYTPVATDVRKIVMQFQDANGWQTLPAMAINSVPYANYADKADDAKKLNGKADTAFVEKVNLPTCITGESLFFDGTVFTCVSNAGGSGSGTVTNVATANAYLTISSSTTTPLITLNVGTAANTVAAGNDSRITGAAQKSANLSDLTSSATARTNLGLGALATQNSIVASDVTSALGYVPAASGSLNAITSLNGSTSATQTFATGITGTVFSIISQNGVHTFNLPLAASGGVVGGVLSNADYVTFANKMNSTSSAVISALGYVPAASGASAVDATALKIVNNLSDVASATVARNNLGLGALATLDFIDLSSALASGTLSVSKLPDSGVVAGTYAKVTVDAKGRVTSSSALNASDINTALGYTAANSSTVNTLDARVTTVSNAVTALQADVAAVSTTTAGKITSSAASIQQVLGYVPAASGASAVDAGALRIANNLSDIASATVARSNLGLGSVLTDIANKITSSTASIIEVLGYTPANSATVTTALNNKITSSAASIAQVLGYVPAVSGAADVSALKIANNLSDVTSATVARNNLGLGSVISDIAAASSTANSKITSSAAAIAQVLGYTPAASGLVSSQWSTSGSAVYYNSGAVGIGTATPQASGKLTVATNGNARIYLQDTTAAADRKLFYLQSGGGQFVLASETDNSVGQNLFTYTTSTDKAYYNVSNLGVGTANPLSKFDVAGGLAVGSYAGNNAAPSNGAIISGNVGIGTSSPTRKLEVVGTSAVVAEFSATGSNPAVLINAIDTSSAQLVLKNTIRQYNVVTNSAGNFEIQDTTAGGTIPFRILGTGVTNNLVLSGGNVGVGTSAPVTKLDVSGGVRISMESGSCTAGLAGTIRYNGGAIEYCNGSNWQALGVSGAGLTLLNGSASNTQTFALGSFGATPGVSTANGVHTFNFPLASTTGVTGGLLSYADYTSFNSRVTSSAASIAQILGYTPAASGAADATALKIANNLSDVASATVARSNLGLGTVLTDIANKITSSSASIQQVLGYVPAASGTLVSSQWVTSGSTLNYNSGNVGVGTSTPLTRVHISNGTNVGSAPHSFSDLTVEDDAEGMILIKTPSNETGYYGFSDDNDDFVAGINYDHVTDSMGFRVNNQPIHLPSMHISSAGNVGIGTASPGNKLHVYDASSSIPLKIESGGSLAGIRFSRSGGINSTLTAGANGDFRMDANENGVDFYVSGLTGNIGIGTTTPEARLHLAEGTSSTAAFKLTSGTLLTSAQSGTIEYDGYNLYFTNGAAVRAALLTTGSAGVTNVNGSTSATQSFAFGSFGATPGVSTAAGVHTFNLPLASTTGVVGGLLSYADYTTFNNKVTSSAVSIAQILGYIPANSATVTTALNGKITSSSASIAQVLGYVPVASGSVTSSQWNTSGTTINYMAGNVGIGTVAPTTKLDVSGTMRSAGHVAFGSGSGVDRSNILYPAITYSSVVAIEESITTAAVSEVAGAINYIEYNPSANASAVGVYAHDSGVRVKAGNSQNVGHLSGGYFSAEHYGSGNVNSISGLEGYIFTNTSGTVSYINGADIEVYHDGAGVAANVYGLYTIVSGTGAITNGYGIYIDGVKGTSNFGLYQASASNKNYFGGIIGLGTQNPSQAITISSAPAILNANSQTNISAYAGNGIRMIANSASATSQDGIMYQSSANGGGTGIAFGRGSSWDTFMSFYTNHRDNIGSGNITEAMRLTSNGYLGIGTSAPTARLHIAAGSAASAPMKFTSGTLLSAAQAGAMEFDGFDFYLTDGSGVRRAIATGTNASTIDDAALITNSSGNIVMYPNAGAGSVVVSATTASTNSNTGSLVIKGGLGISGALYSSGTIVTSGNMQGSSITATSGLIAPYIYGSTAAAGNLTVDSTTNSSKGNILLAPSAATNVGIGLTNPAYKLDVFDIITSASNGAVSNNLYTQIMPTANQDSSSWNYAQYIYSEIPASNTRNVYQTYGMGIDNANMSPNITIQNLYGAYSAAYNDAPNVTISGELAGGWGEARNMKSATINKMYGWWAGSYVASGTVTEANGLWSENSIYGGAVTNLYGVKIMSTVSGGTATNRYGLYLGLPTGSATNDYAIYSAATQKSYLAGNVGIGTASPATKLEVTGRIQATSDAVQSVGDVGRAIIAAHSSFYSKPAVYGLTSGGAISDLLINPAGGNVGIGTTIPSYQLDVQKSLSPSGYVAQIIQNATDVASSTRSVLNLQNKGNGGASEFNLVSRDPAGLATMWVSPTGSSYFATGIGVGVTPTAKLHLASGTATAGTAPLKFTSGTLMSVAQAGALEYDGFDLYFTDGAGVRAAIVTAGTGALASLNGSTSATQTFAFGSFGTTPGVSTAAGVHTFNFPLASAAGVTGGLLSYADYTTFNSKLTSTTAAVIAALPALTGDVTTTGGSTTTTVAKLRGITLSSAAPTSGQVLSFNGTQWVASAIATTNAVTASGTNYDIQINRSGVLGISSNTFSLEHATNLSHLRIGGSGNNWSNGAHMTLVASGAYYTGLELHNKSGGETANDGAQVELRGSNLYINAREATSNMLFLTSGTERMRIDTSGDIGIGTTTPSVLLDVSGAAKVNTLTLNTDGTVFVPAINFSSASNVGMYYGGAGTGLRFAVSSTASSLVIRTSDVYIGAGGGAYFPVSGSMASPDISFFNDADVGMYRPAMNTLGFSTVGAERVRIDSSGNVGIGTTSPNRPLTVSGVIRSTAGGFEFPDGTVQTTAATGANGKVVTSGTTQYSTGSTSAVLNPNVPAMSLSVSDNDIVVVFMVCDSRTSNASSNAISGLSASGTGLTVSQFSSVGASSTATTGYVKVAAEYKLYIVGSGTLSVAPTIKTETGIYTAYQQNCYLKGFVDY